MNNDDAIYILVNSYNNRIKDKFFYSSSNAKDRADFLNKKYPDTCNYRVVKLLRDNQDGRDPIFDYDNGWRHSNN